MDTDRAIAEAGLLRRCVALLRRRLKRLCVWTIIGLAIWLLLSFAAAYCFTRRPHAKHDEPLPTITWGKIRPLRLDTSDGEQLGAWFIAGLPSQPVVVLCHGNGGCRTSCLPQAEIARSAGCGVLLISLRAHGDSSGDYNDFGYSARRDVVAAVDWLTANHPGKRVVVWGQSLGAAAAAFAARELGQRAHGYILECPCRDLRTAVRNRTKCFLPPVLDVLAYGGLVLVSPLVIADIDRISPLEAVRDVPAAAPVLILAGSADKRATLAEAQAFAERLQGHARLVTIEHGDHVRLHIADAVGYGSAITGFLATCQSP
jgi:uncharacterized protein